MNWEGYSENASAALDAAQAAAEELHHGFIGTEHILIGLAPCSRARRGSAFANAVRMKAWCFRMRTPLSAAEDIFSRTAGVRTACKTRIGACAV